MVPVIIGAVLLFATAAVVLAWKRESRSPITRRLLEISTPADTQQVARALSKGEPIEAAQREVAGLLVAQSRRLRRTGWPRLVFGALLLAVPWWLADGGIRWVITGLGALEVLIGILHLTAWRKTVRNAARQGIGPTSTPKRSGR